MGGNIDKSGDVATLALSQVVKNYRLSPHIEVRCAIQACALKLTQLALMKPAIRALLKLLSQQ